MNYSSKLSLVLLLLLVSGACMVSAQEDLDGTLKANNITSTKWIEAQNNLIVNTSINRVYLNLSNGGPTFENFTLYTEYEESGDLITINNATFITARCDLYYARYVYYDFGADYFENFTMRFACYISGIGATGLNENYYFILHEDTVSDAGTLTSGSGDYYMFRLNNDNVGDNYRVLAYTKYSGTNYHNGWTTDNNLDLKWLYVEVVKDGPDINTTIYNYSNYTSVYWSDSLTLPGSSKYRYLYPVNSPDLNLYPGYYIDMYVKELDIGATGPMSGNLYTSNLLVNETSKEAYSVLYEGVENGTTSLECFVSENNSTWTEVVERGELLGGPDPCYLWFRLNSTNGIDTPYLDYYHIFFEDNLGGGLNYTAYNCSSFLNVTGTHFSGNLTSLQEVDSDICWFNETTGSPGFDIQFNFTGIPEDIVSLRLEAYGFYEGNPAHVVNYQIYNHESGSWETLDTMGEGAWEWFNVSLSYNTTNYLNEGNLTMRYYHVTSGSVGHWLGVDYIKVSGYVVVGVSEEPLNPWDINWLTAVIWLALLSIGYLREAQNIKLFSGVVGIVFGLLLLNSVNTMVGVIVLCVSFYLLYEGTGTK